MLPVISCLLRCEGKLLMMRRSLEVLMYKGFWSGVTGFIEGDETPLNAAKREINEELGLVDDEFCFVKSAEAFSCADIYEGKVYEWVVHPFLFEVKKKDRVVLNWENTDFFWVKPSDVVYFKTVPCFDNVVMLLLG